MAQQKGGRSAEQMGRGAAQAEKRSVPEQGKGATRGAEGKTGVESRKGSQPGEAPGQAKGGKFRW